MAQEAPNVGIGFPPGPDGTPSSRLAGTRIMAAALGALDAVHSQEALREPRWRHAYPLHFRRLVEGAMGSAEAALACARAGLDAAWEGLEFSRADGTRATLREALGDAGRSAALHSLRLQGKADERPAPWQVPLRGELLSGTALATQIDDWEARGIVEPSAAESLRRCLRHPEWFDLSDRTVVLLGAGSEAGPLRWLARWRANIVAVDLAHAPVWQRIAGVVGEGNARLVVPLRRPAAPEAGPQAWSQDAGADLLTETPRLIAWLLELAAAHGPLDVAALGYLDGERHLRLALAMDMIQAALCEADARTSLAWMATPTDVFAVPESTARRAMAAYEQRPVLQRGLEAPLRLASGDRLFHPNVERLERSVSGLAWGLVDSLVVEQGPNYALAKRLQQWRAVVARAGGHRSVLNIAPSTTTASVIKNPALAAGFAGASAFGIEVFEPATTNALMAALWVHDLRAEQSAANPGRALAHPHELFMDNACHGGLWTGAYRARSALPLAAALGWLRGRLGLDEH